MSYKSIRHNPYKIVQMFEEEVAEYTGAPYTVAVDSCTNAIFLALKYHIEIKRPDYKLVGKTLEIPKRTYLSVPMSAIHAGFSVKFIDLDWSGEYPIAPTNVWDSAKRFTSGIPRS